MSARRANPGHCCGDSICTTRAGLLACKDHLATNKARTCEKGIYCHTVVTVQIIVAHGQQSNFTDSNGNYAGSAFRYPESTTFVDRNGSFAGTAIPHSGSTSFYDKSGRYTGSVTTQGTASNPLANVNGSNPFGRGGRR